MTDRETIIHLAENVMGWEIKTNNSTGNTIAVDKRNRDNRVHLFGDWPHLRKWNPLESIADAYEVQSALPESVRLKYAHHLLFTHPANAPIYEAIWLIAVATPRQICLAIVKAIS